MASSSRIDFRDPDAPRPAMPEPPGPTPWEQFLIEARMSLIEAERMLGDEEADNIARAAAKKLADGQMRNGHIRALKAHARALAANLGPDAVAEYLEDVWLLVGPEEPY